MNEVQDKTTHFPILIKMKNGETMRCNTANDVPTNTSFQVISTDLDEDSLF